MEQAVYRELQTIQSSWSMPQLLRSLSAAISGAGAALSTSALAITQVDPRIALVVTTSGSTGTPKSVALSGDALISNVRATHEYLGAERGQIWSLLLPTTHIAGLNVLLRSIELGTEPVGVETRADFTAIVPTQLHRALTGDEKLLAHLKSCRSVLVGGGPLDNSLRDRAKASGLNIVTTYGMTESCGGVVYDGRPLAGVEIQIIEDRIAIRGRQLALGYLSGEFPKVDGFFLTSDSGEFIDGKLVVHGRIDDQIISGGVKISLGAIERYLQEKLQNPEIVAFAKADLEWGEQLCLATTADYELAKLAELLKSEFGREVSPKKLVRVASIPYLSIGKPDRKRLANDN